jgi:hypothetical protein
MQLYISIIFHQVQQVVMEYLPHWNWAPSGSAWFSNYKIRIPLSGSVAGGSGGASAPLTATGGTGTAGVFVVVVVAAAEAVGEILNLLDPGGAGGRGTIFSGGGGGGGVPWNNIAAAAAGRTGYS